MVKKILLHNAFWGFKSVKILIFWLLTSIILRIL